MVDYIDAQRDRFGVEPICRVLQMAPSTYYAAKRREIQPSARGRRDAVMRGVVMALWVTNRKVSPATQSHIQNRSSCHRGDSPI